MLRVSQGLIGRLMAVWVVILLGASPLQAELMLDADATVSPEGQLYYLEDIERELSFEQARELLQSQGRRWHKPGQPTFGYTSSAYWLRLDTNNELPADEQWVLRIPFATLGQVDFYYQDGAEWQHKTAGHALAFVDRDLPQRLTNFSFPVRSGEAQSLYLRIQSSGSLQAPLVLSSLAVHQAEMQGEMLLSGAFYGVLFLLGLYGLFMWRSSGDRSYLYFFLFVAFGALHSFVFQGLAYQYFWPESPDWANYALVLVTGLTAIAGLLFAREFLLVEDMAPLWRKLCLGMLAVLLICTYSSAFMPLAFAVRMMFSLVLVSVVLVTALTVNALRSGERAAWYFAGAWAVLMTGILIEMAQRLGLGMPPLLAYRSIQAGTVVGTAILALGLGDRVNQLMDKYRHVQQEMIRANQQKLDALQRTESIKEEFIANVSHELRTPLTGIIGLAEIMLEDREHSLSETDRETLQLMKVSAQRLTTLVNDVIDFSTLKKGHLELQKREVDLKSICVMVARMTRPMLGEKPVSLEEIYPNSRVIVDADEDRLQQILFNLVSNAIKFTQRGSVTIKLEVIDIDARISVLDTGIGISEEEQTKIFKRFYQVDSADSRQSGGTGLGLSITQKLLELHESEIILHSTPGEGSIFYFDLPLKEARRDIAAQQPGVEALADSRSEDSRLAQLMESAAPVIERRRGEDKEAERLVKVDRVFGRLGSILVVDDEYLNLRIVESHLGEQYQLRTASSGSEALELLAEEKPDLVIMDLMMPVMTGFQLCQLIRKRYDMDELPVIILTAKNRVEDLVKGLSVGANDYITKPFNKEELQVRVSKQFELIQLQQVRSENQRLSWQLRRHEQMQDRLRERERRLASMLDITGDALLCVDEAGQVVYINHPAEQLFSVTGEAFQGGSVNALADALEGADSQLREALQFPFSESLISSVDATTYIDYQLAGNGAVPECRGRFCILSVTIDQEFYLLVFEREAQSDREQSDFDHASLPELISEINKNVERTQLLGEYLSRIEPGDLQKHKHLFSDLEQIDQVIQKLSGSVSGRDDDMAYREALVKLMQDCHFYWQKVTGESVIDLAEQSRIWSVSVDNGRLRTRSMNRYLSVDKLPSNPRWRQVARTAYFVLSRISHDQEAREALEASVTRLQDIVEQRALG